MSNSILYHYEAKLMTRKGGKSAVYDGDTVWLEVDAGFGLTYKLGACRLFGINAPEVRPLKSRAAGIAARDYLRDRLVGNDTFMIRTHLDGKGKYGRYLVDIYASDGAHINAELVEKGHAVLASY